MSNFTEGQVHQFMDALEKEGVKPQDLTALGQSPALIRDTLSLIRGNVKMTDTIDLGKSPRLPFSGAEVVKHEGTGVVEIELRSDDNLYLDDKKVGLFLSERQKGDKRIVGHELLQELEGGKQVLLNGNVLDYLYDHPEVFPEHCKQDESGETRYITFWGSVFRNPCHGRLYVRCLFSDGGALDRGCHWLDDGWSRHDPSASFAS